MFRTCALLTMLGLLVLAVVTCGCAGGGDKPVPVSGKVTVGGKPVGNVIVHFMAVGKTHVGTGKTAADGTFSLENGALPGVNKIYFSVVRELPQGVDETALASGAVELPPVENPIPSKYTDPQNPALEFTVPAGGTKEANFDL
ncbi:MAG: hypothetical protein NZ899_07410 [Thermoguttaceae bacterium]|nr:hypothetical protein [Thermoguttaceae bacterium]MDW8079619.1 hypothetical protein [Thermoguttaceae bacterium]